MPHRQAIDFLRRRYAAAILCGDADTAGRMRARLDGIMNPGRGATRLGETPQMEPQASPPPAGLDGLGPRLRLVPSVTGLLEGACRARRR
jgi:hypothetical protein